MSWKDKFAEAIARHPKGKPLNKDGSEIPDPVSMAPPLGYRAQPSMFEVIRKMIHDEKMRQALEAEGLETPEDADDFNVEDDYDPTSPYEHNFDPPGPVDDIDRLKRVRDEIDLRIRNLGDKEKSPPADAPAAGGAPPAEVKPVQ